MSARSPIEPIEEGADRRGWAEVRADFPILERDVNGRPLVYLDTAASSQVPRSVLEAVVGYYEYDHANVHRGVHELSRRATDAYEGARAEVARFLGASADEIVFTRGATEAINLVRYAWAMPALAPGDVVVVSEMEHHSNLVPWQMACEEAGARLIVCPILESADLDLDRLASILRAEPVRLLAVSHVSNTTGAINPVAKICEMARSVGAATLVDGCQAVPHMPVDLGALGADFYALSAHKMYGVTGAGALWIRPERAREMRPFHGGGGMIERVSWQRTTYAEPPAIFEAGTPPIAQAVAMGRAARYLSGLGRARVAEREAALTAELLEGLSGIRNARVVGRPMARAGVVSFVFEDIHAQDVGTLLDQTGVAVRTGKHCTEPLLDRLGLGSTVRASFGVYSRPDDVEALLDGLRFVRSMFE